MQGKICQMRDGSYAVLYDRGIVAFGVPRYETAQDILRACQLQVLERR